MLSWCFLPFQICGTTPTGAQTRAAAAPRNGLWGRACRRRRTSRCEQGRPVLRMQMGLQGISPPAWANPRWGDGAHSSLLKLLHVPAHPAAPALRAHGSDAGLPQQLLSDNTELLSSELAGTGGAQEAPHLVLIGKGAALPLAQGCCVALLLSGAALHTGVPLSSACWCLRSPTAGGAEDWQPGTQCSWCFSHISRLCRALRGRAPLCCRAGQAQAVPPLQQGACCKDPTLGTSCTLGAGRGAILQSFSMSSLKKKSLCYGNRGWDTHGFHRVSPGA